MNIIILDENFLPDVKGQEISGGTNFKEDFINTSNRDWGATTAIGWGTGRIWLETLKLSLAGQCNTIGSAEDVCVVGDYAFVSDWLYGLRIIDISNPSNPILVGSCALPASPYNVRVEGDYAYVADMLCGLQVVNITDPTTPTIAGSCFIPHSAWGLWLEGDYAYIAGADCGLQVIDIADPENPTIAGSCKTPDNASDVRVAGNYAYVTDYDGGLIVIDITNPRNPTIVSSYDTSYPWGVCVEGNYAYIADFFSGLIIVDISDPLNPTRAGNCGTPRPNEEVCVSGNYAYIAAWDNGLLVVDITDPHNPIHMLSFSSMQYAKGVCVVGDYAYVAGENSGLVIINIATFISPAPVGNCNTIDKAKGIYVEGDYAFIADGDSGLNVIDITNPNNPISAGSCNTPGSATGICLAGDYAYIADYNMGLQVMNIASPRSPSLAGSVDTVDYAKSVCVAGDYAYIANGIIGLIVINITNPITPTIAAICNTPGDATDVFIEGDFAYLTDKSEGLQVIDISDPKNPIISGNYKTPGSVKGVFIEGDYAFISDDSNRFIVLNITNPKNPTLAGWCFTQNSPNGIWVDGDYAYVADNSMGLQMINITDPSNPVRITNCLTTGNARDVYVEGDFAFVANDLNGLCVVEIKKNQCRQYKFSAIGQSMEIDKTDKIIYNATLISINTTPIGTAIKYYLSADGGMHWELITPNLSHNFTNPGSVLRWRTLLSTTDKYLTPVIFNISILYSFDSTPPFSNVNKIEPFWQSSINIEINWSVIDDYALKNITLFYRFSADNNAWSNWTSSEYNDTILGESSLGNFTFIAINGDGYYEFYTVAQDTSNNLEPAPLTADAAVGIDTGIPTANTPQDPGIFNNSGVVNWTWSSSPETLSGIIGYYVCIGTTPDCSDTVINDFTTRTWYQKSELKDDNEYYCKISAKNGAGTIGGYGPSSDGIYIDTDIPVTHRPTSPGQYNNTGTVRWSWEPSSDTGSGIIGYYLSIGTTNGNDNVVKEDWTTKTWYEKTNLQDGSTYYCKIKAKNGAGTIGNFGDISYGITIDLSPPHSLSISINNESVETNSTQVKLFLNAFDNTSGVDKMAFSSDGIIWSEWEPYRNTKSYSLSSGDGLKTIYFKVRDYVGNIALPVQDSIILNTTQITTEPTTTENTSTTNNESLPDESSNLNNNTNNNPNKNETGNQDSDKTQDYTWVIIIVVIVIILIIVFGFLFIKPRMKKMVSSEESEKGKLSIMTPTAEPQTNLPPIQKSQESQGSEQAIPQPQKAQQLPQEHTSKDLSSDLPMAIPVQKKSSH